MECVTRYRPHDLLWLTRRDAFVAAGSEPTWLTQHWTIAQPVVVRREYTQADTVAVGIRGHTRDRRMAGYVHRDAVARCVRPEDLVETLAWQDTWTHTLQTLPALIALHALFTVLEQVKLPWGPTGSVGYALATKTVASHAASDLDLVLRADRPLLPSQRKHLRSVAHYAHCKIDIQIDTPHGGFAFSEWDGGAKSVLLRTDHGPRLVTCPWEDSSRQL